MVKFHPGGPEPQISMFDRVRCKTEQWIGCSVDWSPLPPLVRPCLEGEVRVDWKAS